MLELSEELLIRSFRLEARYTAMRLLALAETRAYAKDFEDAYDKFALLEEEGAHIDVRKVESQAQVEMADDAWDDTMLSFQRRLLEVVENDVNTELYRSYFADIPSHVTSLSYAAESMISKELESKLAVEAHPELHGFASRLEDRRRALESSLQDRTRLEVDEARFQNRVALAKAILNKLRRVLFASLEETARARGLPRAWCLRFFQNHDGPLRALDFERPDDLDEDPQPALPEGEVNDPSTVES